MFNLTKCVGQIKHFSQVDWFKNTCFRPLVKMDMSISKKRLINQFEPFEKPRILEMCMENIRSERYYIYKNEFVYDVQSFMRENTYIYYVFIGI